MDGERDYLLICNTSDGLIAQLNGVGVQLQLARRLGLRPIVHLHRRSHMFGGPNPYFEESQGPNVWDYYYEPVGPSGDELQALIAAGRVLTLSNAAELARLHRWEPRSWTMNPYGYFRSVENRADGPYPAAWWARQRDRGHALFEDGTIRIAPHIARQVEKFVAESFPAKTLGVQLRGSDKFDFGTGPNLARKVLPEEYFPHIDRYLADNPDCEAIFVATDQRQWLKVLKEAYPDKVISFSQWSLSDSDANMFHASDRKAARGAEVIVDMLLLSHCDYVLKCHASVGEMALTLNRNIDFVDLNYLTQPFEARPTALRPFLVPVLRAGQAGWARMSEGGRGLVQVVSVDGEEIVVDPRRPRPLNEKETHDGRAARPPILSARFVSNMLRWALNAMAARCYHYVTLDGQATR